MNSKQLVIKKTSKIILFCIIILASSLTSCQSDLPIEIVKEDFSTVVSNYNNFSYMTEDKNKIYFSSIIVDDSALEKNKVNYNELDTGIYCMDLIGNKIQKINNTYGRFLQVVEDKIYFNTWTPEKGIYRMNLDGSKLELIIDGAWLEFFVYEEAIYYISDMDQPFRKYDLKTGETSIIIDEFGAIKWISDDFMYFSYDNDISSYYRLDLGTKEIQKLKESEDTPQRFSYDGESIYYSTFDSIYRLDISKVVSNTIGNEEKIVSNINGGKNLLVNGRYFYYFDLHQVNSFGNGNDIKFDLYRVNMEGQNKELLFKDLDQRSSMYILEGDLYITQIDTNTSMIKGYYRFNFADKKLYSLIYNE